jgi:MoaA/NifB/PqqE/SkfB family radical SAM enzyme
MGDAPRIPHDSHAPVRDGPMTHAAPALRVYWELTRACDLACRHCRAEAQPARAPDELTTEECFTVLGDLAGATPRPHVIFTGGDPLKRPDLLDLVREGVRLGLGVSVAPSATTSLTREAVRALKEAGVQAMSLSLDGSIAARHDAIRGVLGCFGWTLAAAQRITAAGIPLQVNTLVTRETAGDLEAIGDLVAEIGAARWSLFFLVAVGRGRVLTPLSAAEAETTLGWVARQHGRWPFVLTTTEAPHYRRIAVQQMRAGRRARRRRGTPLARRARLRHPRRQRHHVHRRQRRRDAVRLPAPGRGQRPPGQRALALPGRRRVPGPALARDVPRPLRRLHVPGAVRGLAGAGVGGQRRRPRRGPPVRLGPSGKARRDNAARRSSASKHCVVTPRQSGRLLDTP